MNQNEKKDSVIPCADPKNLEEFKNLVISFLTRLSQVAKGAIDKLRVLMMISLGCAAWLTFFVMSSFKLSLLGVMPAVLGFAFPALLIWKLHRTLKDVAGLPEHLPVLADGIEEVYADLKREGVERINALNEAGQVKKRFKSVFRRGRQFTGLKTLLTGLKSMPGQSRRPEIIESVIMVAGPGFVFLMTLATIGTVMLSILTAISAGVYLVFI